MAVENPRIEWEQKSGRDCLSFTFGEHLAEDEAIVAIQKWREAFASKPGARIVLIWNCLAMKGYDSEARRQWQQALKEMKKQVEIIWVVTSSPVVQMGASVMGLFTGMDIKTIRSADDIVLHGST